MTSARTRERLKRYPKDWKAIVRKVRTRSENACECRGECGLEHLSNCGAPNGEIIERREDHVQEWRIASLTCSGERWGGWKRPIKVILTTAHVCPAELGHDEGCSDLRHLLHCCQLCHLRIDRFLHADHAAETRERKRRAGTLELFT